MQDLTKYNLTNEDGGRERKISYVMTTALISMAREVMN